VVSPGAGEPERDIAEVVAREVRGLRARQRLTQAQLAARAGVGENLIGELENGRANPTLSSLAKVAAGLGVEIGALFRGEAPPA
jgi:transcriptional regulator with XRE-family HTH domain